MGTVIIILLLAAILITLLGAWGLVGTSLGLILGVVLCAAIAALLVGAIVSTVRGIWNTAGGGMLGDDDDRDWWGNPRT